MESQKNLIVQIVKSPFPSLATERDMLKLFTKAGEMNSVQFVTNYLDAMGI